MFFKKNNLTLDNKVEVLTSQVAKLQATIEDQISSMIGIDKWFNTDHQHKDQEIVKTGGANFRKTWALMSSKNILYIDDYPVLFEVLNAEDRGDGTFAMPDFHDGTLRHIIYGDSRELGTFEMDSMESHTHSNTHSHTENAHNHPINDIKGSFNYDHSQNGFNVDDMNASGGFYITETVHGNIIQNYPDSSLKGQYNFSSGITETNNATATINNATITTDVGTGKSSPETRMKNTSGQWYMLAKVTYVN